MRSLRTFDVRVALMCAAVAVVFGGGCGGSSDAGRPATVQVVGDALELAAYREVASEYRRRTGRSVRLVEVADRDSHLAKLTTSFSAGHAPDVFLLSYRNYGPFAARNVLEPAGPRLADSDALQPSDFYQVALRAFTTAGTLQCMPLNASPLVVYVNRKLFAAAGLDAPPANWSFADLFRAALNLREHLRRSGSRRPAHALGIDPNLQRLAPFVWGSGGAVVDDAEAPSRFTLETPAARRGIDRFLSLYREGLVPTENEVEGESLELRFRAGRLAMYVGSRREVPTFRGAERLSWDVVAFPSAERDANELQSDAYCLARGPRADAAWRFVEFAVGPDGQRIVARSGRVAPALRAVAESPDFLQAHLAPRNSRVFIDVMASVRALPHTANWPRIEDAASLAFKRAFYAEVTVEQAIERVTAETEGLF